ncbi:conserved hypothetical protein [Cellulomonas flavigena DSM 20109]|uniref:Uncharacterized protein n=1 Tax=Cellulomonas flavigena (strain ATCC 482 / DSM 20109 / BCRC 11376 / JCM 18109 / NBRC 3775 / NCIMB 8073 / NRS 134) TaxID=446466 RepID=D5UHA6_CELFN|nr:hypothetical protein [Cellulomonas flavigena]ADG73309.1 conserved hypothetical protein [Cellulomonas flavigena DSM 20109]
MAEFVRSDPSMWEAVFADPSVPLDRSVVRQIIDDQRRPSRRWLYPFAMVLSRVLVTLIRILKRVLPFRWMPLGAMDFLCVWFLRRCVSPDAVDLLLRHFVIETNLVNFIIRNTPVDMEPVRLRPESLSELGDQAVVEHDVNVYDVLIALDVVPLAARDTLDFQQLDVPPLDAERHRRRLLRLDIQTALCFMNIPFSLALSSEEYRRAVHSMRFDDSFLEILAVITGDDHFRHWKLAGMSLWMDSNVDVPRMVYRHALVCEYAHAQLVKLAGGQYPRDTAVEFD